MFTTTLACASFLVQARDRMMGRVPNSRPEFAGIATTQHKIKSGKNVLDACFARPAGTKPACAVLICHGIGEIVPQWFPIQRIFAEAKIATLVFDYSGYGRSTGRPDWRQCEQDAVASCDVLQSLAPEAPIFLLGFSLGTGVAPAVLDRVAAQGLILCAGYSSFRSAARSARVPRFLSPLVAPIWSAKQSLENRSIPVLVVQGDRDGLFPMKMGQELKACCGDRAEFLLLPARSHNEPFYRPQQHYWGPIVEWILSRHSPATPAANVLPESL